MWNLKVLFFSAIPSVVSTQAAAQLVGTEPASCSKWREVNSGPKLDYVSTKRNNEARPVNIEPAPALCSKQREVDPGANIGYISTDVSHHIVGQPVNTEPVPTSSSKRRSDLGEAVDNSTNIFKMDREQKISHFKICELTTQLAGSEVQIEKLKRQAREQSEVEKNHWRL